MKRSDKYFFKGSDTIAEGFDVDIGRPSASGHIDDLIVRGRYAYRRGRKEKRVANKPYPRNRFRSPGHNPRVGVPVVEHPHPSPACGSS